MNVESTQAAEFSEINVESIQPLGFSDVNVESIQPLGFSDVNEVTAESAINTLEISDTNAESTQAAEFSNNFLNNTFLNNTALSNTKTPDFSSTTQSNITTSNPFDTRSESQEIIMSFIHIGIENFIVFPQSSVRINGFNLFYAITGDNIKYKKTTGFFVLQKGFFYKMTAYIILSAKSPACNMFYQFYNETSSKYIGIHSNVSVKKTKCIAYINPEEKVEITLKNKNMDVAYCLLTGSLKIKCSTYMDKQPTLSAQ